MRLSSFPFYVDSLQSVSFLLPLSPLQSCLSTCQVMKLSLECHYSFCVRQYVFLWQNLSVTKFRQDKKSLGKKVILIKHTALKIWKPPDLAVRFFKLQITFDGPVYNIALFYMYLALQVVFQQCMGCCNCMNNQYLLWISEWDDKRWHLWRDGTVLAVRRNNLELK